MIRYVPLHLSLFSIVYITFVVISSLASISSHTHKSNCSSLCSSHSTATHHTILYRLFTPRSLYHHHPQANTSPRIHITRTTTSHHSTATDYQHHPPHPPPTLTKSATTTPPMTSTAPPQKSSSTSSTTTWAVP